MNIKNENIQNRFEIQQKVNVVPIRECSNTQLIADVVVAGKFVFFSFVLADAVTVASHHIKSPPHIAFLTLVFTESEGGINTLACAANANVLCIQMLQIPV